jgi:hypothetical protein
MRSSACKPPAAVPDITADARRLVLVAWAIGANSERSQARLVISDHGVVLGAENPGSKVGYQVQLEPGLAGLTCIQ